MTRRRWLWLAAVTVLVLLGGRLIASLVVDYRWFATLGAGPLAVWKARVSDLAALRLLLSLAGGAFVFANLFGVTSSVESLVLPRRLGDLEIGEKVPGRQLLWSAAVLAVALGILLSLLLDDWMSFDLVQFGHPFGVPEPYTGADLSFFVYWLPFENALYLWAIATLLATATLVILLYALTTGLRWDQGRLRATRHVKRHLTALAAGLLLMLAWGHRLDAYALLSAGSGPDAAFVYVDHAIVLRSRFVLATITAIAALLVLNAGWQGQGRFAFWVVSAVLVVTLLLRGLVPVLGARTSSPQRAAERDGPYLRNRAAVTQNAYGVNRIVRAPTYGYPSADAAASALPLWDPAVLAHAIERERRGEVVGDEIGWQSVGGRLGAVAVTRPTPQTNDGEPASWGTLVASGSQADAAGDPVLLDSAGAVTAGLAMPEAIGRDRRLVSFPQATGYAIVSDSARRVAGDPIQSFGARLAHAWDERDFRLLFADAADHTDNPVIVLRRDVRERVGAIAPFFVQGHAVSPLLARDTLYWVVQLYAASASFPLSQRYQVGGEAWGYFQHAGAAVVNAETGTVSILPVANPDRITQAWLRRFPALFGGPLPRDVAASLPPPTDGVLLQAWALWQYGSRGDIVGTPVHIPGGDGGDSTLGVAARALALLPSAGGATRVPGWTLPLLDSSDRVAGVLVALGGPSPTTLWMPSREAGGRWNEIGERLRGAATTVVDGGEARETSRGRIRAVPIGGRLTLMQPVYVVRGAGQAAVGGVVAIEQDSVRAQPTLAAALGVATAADRIPASPPLPTGSDARLRALYDAMRAALRRGDFTAFGALFDSLGAALGRVPR